MAGHEWEDWFEREEFIGQISDIRVQNLQVEREVVQKRTFTRWMNLHLEKCNPPMEVKDLFGDIQDGRILMALLEELSGCKLLHGFKKSAHRIFRLNNIAKVLTFLEERNVKLVSIDAADVADGNASIVLGLIWNIILFFQIKELTGNIRSQFPSSSSLSSIPTSSDSDTSHSSTPSEDRRPSAAMRDQGKAIKTLLQWVQRRTRKYAVAVHDFGKSWSSGLAFLAVIKSIDPSLVDMRKSLLRPARENLEDAFRTAHYSLGIPRLLEPEDVTINPPDEQSIMTYVSQFLAHFPGIEEPQDVSAVIERSVSMGRLSSRSSDSELVRNGVHRSRQQDRPYVVRKDWVQTPPKIFISSVSEDKGVLSPTTLTSLGNRPWANRNSSEGSTPSPGGDPQDTGKEVFTICTSNSPQPCYIDSIVESSAIESIICDSAIGSPDSWVDNEALTVDRFVESRSDGSLCDSGVAWDANIPSTTPEEVTLEEGLLPSVTGKPQDEQSQSELFIDEGVYSLSSVDSTLERANDSSDASERKKKKEENAQCSILDLNENGAAECAPDQKQNLNKTEDSEQRKMTADELNGTSCERRASLELSDMSQQYEAEGTSQSQHSFDRVTSEPFKQTEERGGSTEQSTDRNSECVNAAMAFSRNLQEVDTEMSSRELCDHPSQSDGSEEVKMDIVSVTEHGTSPLSEREGEDERLKSVLNERVLQDVSNGHIEPQGVTATQSGNVLEQTDTCTSVDKDQIWTSQAQLSESALDLEENHIGHNTTSEKSVSPKISVCDDPLKGDEERTRSPERENHDVDEDTNQHGSSGEEMVGQADGSPEVPESTSIKTTDFVDSPVAETQQGAPWTTQTQQGISESPVEKINHLGNVEVREVTEVVQASTVVGHSLVDPHTPTCSTGKERPGKDTANQLDGFQEAVKATTVDDTADKISDTKQGELTLRDLSVADNEVGTAIQNKVVSGPMHLFYSENDRSSPLEEPMSELLEPMDLFYPDTEEGILPNQPEREDGMFSSLSMLALQPAPASEPLPDTHLHGLEESESPGVSHPKEQPGDVGQRDDFERTKDKTQHEQEKLIEETREGPGGPSEPQERCVVPGWNSPGGWGVLEADSTDGRSDLTQTDEEKLAAARENMESMSWKEVQSPVAECVATVSELYMLLLLWLLVYCVMLLRQLDIRSLPSLLLNLED